MSTITSRQFVQQFSSAAKHGVIDLNNLSPELSKAIDDAGIRADLQKLAGPDGHIKGSEFDKLFKVLDGFDGKPGDKKLDLGTAQAPTVAGTLNEAFKAEVARNIRHAQYARPGTTAAAEQPRLTQAGSALVVPENARKPEVELKVTGMSQYDYAAKHGLDGDTACFPTAKAQTDGYNQKTFGKQAPTLNGPYGAIQIAYAEDKAGRVSVDPTQARIGREYIDKCLEAGHPVLVGVSYADKSYNIDKMTDHFVTIHKRGYDEAGRLYYDFKDPGDGGRGGRFYVDQNTRKLFKEGDQKTGYVRSSDYEVTQVRTYQGIN